jgi:Ca2+-binding RTX toxin-like protein
MRRFLLASTALAALAFAPAALAARVQMGSDYYGLGFYYAGQGETNDVLIVPAPPYLSLVHDSGAAISGDCTALASTTTLCNGLLVSWSVYLEDGNDSFSGSATRVFGGDGNDRISGAAMLIGGRGDDTIDTQAGLTRVDGGEGNDRITSSYGGGGDEIACGAGYDVATVDSEDVVAGDCESVTVVVPSPIRAR